MSFLEIEQAADNPVENCHWWAERENPWQCLATCKELVSALRTDDPTSYVGHVPVHQDGSCNGLQHYAALGGDTFGAKSVNLLPAAKPQDVYSEVADLVQERLERDAENGSELAKKLVGKVGRKIVKRPVMTTVYGVTFVGARRQVQGEMKDLGTVSDDDLAEASYYITKLLFESMENMFHGARNIMSWLRTCAQLICKEGDSVMWTTPLGLPVVQPYRRPGRMMVRTVVQSVLLASTHDGLPVNSKRQQSAFPPNYVHSLDSTHMLMTTKTCAQANITFGSVHDSYWTHPCSVPVMNEILREEFIKLHSSPLLEELLQSFQAKYPHIDFPPVPEKGELDLKEIKKSDYFFS